MAMFRQLRRGTDGCIYSCDMEPGEKFIRRLLKFVFMILAFVVAIVFGELSFGMGWFGAVIFIVGASSGRTGHLSLEGFEKLRGTSPFGQPKTLKLLSAGANECNGDFSPTMGSGSSPPFDRKIQYRPISAGL